MTEEEIIKGCISEKREAQEALYKKYASKMLGVCYRYASDLAEAEDMLQEGFIKVFDNISSFSFKGSFEGWVRRIMIHVALNKIRSKSKVLDFVEEFNFEVEDLRSPLDKLQHKQLLAALNQLPEGYKIVFNLYAVEGYSHAEIAKFLAIKEASSRSQYAKAKSYLQKLIIKLEKVNL
jgi:RNA polymerase sigma factor (sigma-70 family)